MSRIASTHSLETLFFAGIQEYGLFDAVNFLIKKHESFQADLGTANKLSSTTREPLSKQVVGTQSIASDSLVPAVELKIDVAKTQTTGGSTPTPTNVCSDLQNIPVSSQKSIAPLRVHETSFGVGAKTDQTLAVTKNDKEAQDSSAMLRKDSHGSETGRYLHVTWFLFFFVGNWQSIAWLIVLGPDVYRISSHQPWTFVYVDSARWTQAHATKFQDEGEDKEAKPKQGARRSHI